MHQATTEGKKKVRWSNRRVGVSSTVSVLSGWRWTPISQRGAKASSGRVVEMRADIDHPLSKMSQLACGPWTMMSSSVALRACKSSRRVSNYLRWWQQRHVRGLPMLELPPNCFAGSVALFS